MKINPKKFVSSLVIFLTPIICFSQQIKGSDYLLNQKDLLKNFHWFRERINRIDGEKRWKYYSSGNEYEIQIDYTTKRDLIFSTQKGLVKLLSAGWEKKSDKSEKDIPDFPLPNRIFYSLGKIGDTINLSSSLYVVPDFSDSVVYKISMFTYYLKDSLLEKDIVLSILKNGIQDSLFLAPGPNMIDFSGRIITIEKAFHWMAPNNIYCPNSGQMNWSDHNSLDKANRARDLQLLKNNDVKIVDVLKADTIDILFEGSKQQAIRVTYRAKTPRIFWGKGSKILIVYYIVATLRDRFVHCVLSHYEDQLIKEDVPPPLNSVMSLKL